MPLSATLALLLSGVPEGRAGMPIGRDEVPEAAAAAAATAAATEPADVSGIAGREGG